MPGGFLLRRIMDSKPLLEAMRDKQAALELAVETVQDDLNQLHDSTQALETERLQLEAQIEALVAAIDALED